MLKPASTILLYGSAWLLMLQIASAQSDTNMKPLPDIVPMMNQVVLKQRAIELAQKDYLVHEIASYNESFGHCDPFPAGSPRHKDGQCLAYSQLAMNGDTRESEVFWLEGVRVSRLLSTNGFRHHDRPCCQHTLSPDELRRENVRIDDELTQVANARASGDVEGERRLTGTMNELQLSRLLELGNLSNPRRGVDTGEDTILVDYLGRACMTECSPLDSAASHIKGTLAIAEPDLVVANFKGVFMDTWVEPGAEGHKVLKDSEVSYLSDRLYGGSGFPVDLTLFTIIRRGKESKISSVSIRFKDYRKFRVTSRILPDYALISERGDSRPLDLHEPK